ncbi:nucleotide-binding alpha-beta plait domain-containing protein, partial [Tanacetum coccineum]
MMGSYRSKEDDVAKISTSIYVTNFPESFSAKDLFNSCKVYGHVVDSFIPSKRSKIGKRFGFVRFINVFSEERLVNNLCTIWVGRLKFHANIARFQRAPMSAKKNQPNIVAESNRSRSYIPKKDKGFNATEKSYVHVVKGNPHSGSMGSDPKPAIALDDDCLLTKDLRNPLLCRVQEFASLSNLRMTLINEGWVPDFLEESNDDESDVESKGGDPKTHDLGSCGEDGDVVEVPETLFEEERHSNDIPVEENTNSKENHSKDLFGIYSLLNKNKATIGEDGPSDQSPIYPPGFTPAATINEPCTN